MSRSRRRRWSTANERPARLFEVEGGEFNEGRRGGGRWPLAAECQRLAAGASFALLAVLRVADCPALCFVRTRFQLAAGYQRLVAIAPVPPSPPSYPNPTVARGALGGRTGTDERPTTPQSPPPHPHLTGGRGPAHRAHA